jgi:hypothetical protein
MGSAYQLAGDGRRVLGLERYTPPHEKGSSQGRSRVIRQAYFEDPAYVPLLLRACYKFASVIGEILADHAIDGSTRHPIGLFFPDRLAVRE